MVLVFRGAVTRFSHPEADVNFSSRRRQGGLTGHHSSADGADRPESEVKPINEEDSVCTRNVGNEGVGKGRPCLRS